MEMSPSCTSDVFDEKLQLLRCLKRIFDLLGHRSGNAKINLESITKRFKCTV